MQDHVNYILNSEDNLTVRSLIDILLTFPQDMKVCTTWESTINGLEKQNIYVSRFGVLLIDADGNCYKEDYEEVKNAMD